MEQEVATIVSDLKAVQEKFPRLRDLFWVKMDYSNENDRKRCNEFDREFEIQCQKINRRISKFTSFIEKQFAPTQEEMVKQRALQKLRRDFPDFDNWDAGVRDALLERELKNATYSTPKEERQTNGRVPRLKDNPDLERPYSITDNMECCKPYRLEFLSESYNISSWRDMCCTIIAKLYEKDPSVIEDYLEKDIEKPLLARSVKPYRAALNVVSDIFAEGNLSTNDICLQCRRVMDMYHVSYSEATIYLRKIPAK